MVSKERGGAGGVLFQPVASVASLTGCLSRDIGVAPGDQFSAGQKREESGVNSSSAITSSPSTRPSSNFVSAIITPLSAA